MKKLIATLPMFFLTMCGTAPVIDPPAHACSPRLDGEPTYCPDERDLILVPRDKVTLPREAAQGEIDIRNPYHWQSLQMMFQRNVNKGKIERNATSPSAAINNALDDFMEAQYGSNGSTEQEKLL